MTPASHAARPHCELSPSSAYRWTACPGSVRLSRGVPKPKSSPYADEGTVAHELAERYLRYELTGPVSDQVGTVVTTSAGREVVIDDEFAAAVQVYVDYCLTIADLSDWTAVERPISLDAMQPPAPMYGTADFIGVVGDTLHVVDLKFGRGIVVEVLENLQALYYALGAYLALDSQKSAIKRVVATIVQPRAPHVDGPLRSWVVGVEELPDRVISLFDAAKAAMAADAPLSAGKHCRFCPAQAVCPEASKVALEVARSEFGVVDSAPPAPQSLSLSQLSELMDRFDDVERWMASVRSYAQDAAERGKQIPGWKLVEKRANRKWCSEESVREWGDRSGVSVLAEPEVMSPAQLEKALGKNKGMFPSDLVVKQSSGLTLAPSYDKRTAVNVTPAAAEFSAIEGA